MDEGTNRKYFTNTRAINAFSTDATVLKSNTGQISIPQSVATTAVPTFGGLYLNGNLDVTGTSVFAGDISANDISGANLDLTGDFNVTGTSVFTGDISANTTTVANLVGNTLLLHYRSVFTGDISANKLTASNLDLTGTLDVTGVSVFTGDVSANDISGANLALTENLKVVGNVNIAGGFGFNNASALQQDHNISPSTTTGAINTSAIIGTNVDFVTTATTFGTAPDVYTIGQVVAALRVYGLLA